jgi:hypothetical protein
MSAPTSMLQLTRQQPSKNDRNSSAPCRWYTALPPHCRLATLTNVPRQSCQWLHVPHRRTSAGADASAAASAAAASAAVDWEGHAITHQQCAVPM